jgi:cupin-like protein
MSHAAITKYEEKDAGHVFEAKQLLEFEAEEFRRKFNRQAFLVRHNLSRHPLLELQNLVELSRRLPAEHVQYNSGTLAVTEDLDHAPQTGLSVQQTIERIEECRSWMVLKYIENDPQYRELLLTCLREVKAHSEALDPGMCDEHGFIFITSPNSVTPCHIDPEINCLLQIRGSKTMSVFDPLDREMVSEEQLENFFARENFASVNYRDSLQARAFEAQLGPGVGVHCPVTAPHWVKNGPDVSISFSITFRTLATQRRSRVYQMNARMRSAGLKPAPVGKSRLRDAAKHSVWRTLSALKRVLPPGQPRAA